MIQGTVMRSLGGTYDVDTPDGVVPATLRGRLKLDERVGGRVVVGDRVGVQPPDRPDDPWTIERVDDRTSSLVRKAPGKAPKPKVIVANIDRVLIVFAAARPEPHLGMLDRFLVICESSELEPVIVVNKVEVNGIDAARKLFGVYEEIGYPVMYVSVKSGEGMAEIRELLCGGISVLTGPSGVGKSSLVNQIEPGLGLRVGAISETVGKGQHTTVTAELIRLGCGGYVADTPGLRELGLWGIDPDELDLCFPEFDDYRGGCKYGNSCTHTHEPGCAVAAAAAGGKIPPSRFDAYQRLYRGDDLGDY